MYMSAKQTSIMRILARPRIVGLGSYARNEEATKKDSISGQAQVLLESNQARKFSKRGTGIVTPIKQHTKGYRIEESKNKNKTKTKGNIMFICWRSCLLGSHQRQHRRQSR